MKNTLVFLCRIAFQFFRVHRTKTISILCSDFRFFKGTLKLYRSLGIEWPDEIKIPGGPMSVARKEGLVLHWIEILYKLHQTEEVYLISHSECGAYREEGFIFNDSIKELDFHKAELEEASQVVRELLPSVRKVVLIHARLSEKRKLIEYVKIES